MIALIEGRGREDRPPGGRGGKKKKQLTAQQLSKRMKGQLQEQSEHMQITFVSLEDNKTQSFTTLLPVVIW